MALQPIARLALLAAYHSPDHVLRRTRDGYASAPVQVRRRGPAKVEVFTRRAVNRLDDAGLVQLDDPRCPTLVRLNTRGEKYAEQLLAENKAVPA